MKTLPEACGKNAKPVTPGKQVDCCLAKALSKCKRELFSGVMVTCLGGAAARSTKREGALEDLDFRAQAPITCAR